jgi:hypothetical protein
MHYSLSNNWTSAIRHNIESLQTRNIRESDVYSVKPKSNSSNSPAFRVASFHKHRMQGLAH